MTKRTLCPRCNKGHVVWTGGSTNYYFVCSHKRACGWMSRPLTGGNSRLGSKFVPKPLPPKKEEKRKKFQPSFVSETDTTITIQRRSGEIATIDKIPYEQVVLNLLRAGDPHTLAWAADNAKAREIAREHRIKLPAKLPRDS